MMLAEESVKDLVKVLAILSKKGIGGGVGNTFLMKYRYRYRQYFLKILLTTLLVSIYTWLILKNQENKRF